MWGLDSRGIRVLSNDEVEDVRSVGAFMEAPVEFTFAELFQTAFPFTGKLDKKTKKPIPTSLTQLRNAAKDGALKWGPDKVSVDELAETQLTNQDFCVIAWGKRRREMIFFTDKED
jgi:hypothetical protein